MSRQPNETGGAKYHRHVPARQSAPPSGELPTVYSCAGFLGLCDLLLRRGVFLGLWRGRDGCIVFIDLKDGKDFRRYGCTSEAQLSGVIAALYEEYDDGQA